jgi:hypothetical protein
VRLKNAPERLDRISVEWKERVASVQKQKEDVEKERKEILNELMEIGKPRDDAADVKTEMMRWMKKYKEIADDGVTNEDLAAYIADPNGGQLPDALGSQLPSEEKLVDILYKEYDKQFLSFLEKFQAIKESEDPFSTMKPGFPKLEESFPDDAGCEGEESRMPTKDCVHKYAFEMAISCLHNFKDLKAVLEPKSWVTIIEARAEYDEKAAYAKIHIDVMGLWRRLHADAIEIQKASMLALAEIGQGNFEK